MPVGGGVAGGGIGGFSGGANFVFGGARVFDGRASDGEPTCIEAINNLHSLVFDYWIHFRGHRFMDDHWRGRSRLFLTWRNAVSVLWIILL